MAKARITKQQNKLGLDTLFEQFIAEKTTMGTSEPTIRAYKITYGVFRKYTQSEEMSKEIVIGFIGYLKNHYSSLSSVNHHIRNIRAFVYYAFDNGLNSERFKITTVKGQEEVKTTYTNEELVLLLAKPTDDCDFAEYRNWIIVQMLIGTGIRASTLLNIQLKDISLSSRQLILAHTKNKKAQIIPLSSTLCKNLNTYISLYRDANNHTSYLFPNVYDEQMNYNALRLAISRYNRKRGVDNTSIHSFRHTFAKQWILNHGDSIVLQKMLGHSSMEMTRRYVNLFSTDLNKDFDDYCPLESLMPKGKKHVLK